MTSSTSDCIAKLLRGEKIDMPIVLMVEEAIQLHCEENEDNGMINYRLRLSDSKDSFSGFVCRTRLINDLRPGVFVRIDSMNIDTLDENKILCTINDISIYRTSNTTFHSSHTTSSASSTSNSGAENKLVHVPMVNIDLSCGKKAILSGQVVNKTCIRPYGTNGGKFFSFDIMDQSATLRVKAFNRECDRVYPLVIVGKTIQLAIFDVVVANKHFSPLSSDYEILVHSETKLSCAFAEQTIPVRPTFNFRKIKELETLELNAFYDCIGVVKSVAPLDRVQQRGTGRTFPIVRLLLSDETEQIEICLWNELAIDFHGEKHDVVIVKEFRLTEYRNKRSLSSVMASNVLLNPVLEEAHQLHVAFALDTDHIQG